MSALPQPTPAPNARPIRVRWRGIAAGLTVGILLNAFDPVASYLIHSSAFSQSHLPMSLLIGVIALAFGLNPILRALRPDWVLSPADMAAALAIGFFCGTMPNMVLRVLAVISAPDYFASPENEWGTYVLPNLQRWLIPSNAGDGIAMFYRGIEPGASFPWQSWVGPLFPCCRSIITSMANLRLLITVMG